MAEAGGQMVEFDESTAQRPGERQPGTDASPFVAQVEQLATRVRNAKLRDDQRVLDNLEAWIERAEDGRINFPQDGENIIARLESNVDEMIQSRTLVRRVAAPAIGLGILYGILSGVTAWAAASDVLFLGSSLSIAVAAVLFGIAGSSFRVLLRTVSFQYGQTDRGALFLLGIARPVVGGLLGLAVFAMFGSGWVSLPLVSEQTAGTNVGFLAFPGSGPGVLAGQLALFAIAFIAGLLEGIFIPAAGRGVARVANTVARATTN